MAHLPNSVEDSIAHPAALRNHLLPSAGVGWRAKEGWVTETIGFLGGDARMARLAGLLAEDGFEVRAWCLPGAPGEARPGEAMAAERIVLPAPLEREGCLNGTTLPLEELWERLAAPRRLYAGAASEAARAAAERRGLRLTDYLADEALAIQNAVPTAEGALAAAMSHTGFTLHGAPCLVVGFGRIGKLLARDLAALGARVSVSARRAEDLAWIGALGYAPLHTERLAGRLGGFRVIFNTAPAPVLDAALLRELRRDCVLIELAAGPGIDEEAARLLKIEYVKASGLPGKAAPETAALALRDALYRIWKEENA